MGDTAVEGIKITAPINNKDSLDFGEGSQTLRSPHQPGLFLNRQIAHLVEHVFLLGA